MRKLADRVDIVGPVCLNEVCKQVLCRRPVALNLKENVMFENLTTPQKALLLGGAAVFFIGAIAVSGPDPATQTFDAPVVSEAPVGN